MAVDPVHPSLAVLLGGAEPDARQREQVELHLLDCDACWRAVRDDRAGRLAVEALRDCAPVDLRDRIALALETSGAPARRRGQRRRPTVMAAAVAVAAIGVAAGALAGGAAPRAGDNPILTTITRLADAPPGAAGPVPVGGAAQRVTVTLTTMDAVTVVVARSDTPFTMPDRAVPMTSADTPWLAQRGPVTLVCLNLPHPILVAARLPADALVALAHRLDATPPSP